MAEINIIPEPKSMQVSNGVFTLEDGMTIGYSDDSLRPAAEYLAMMLSRPTGYQFLLQEGEGAAIQLSLAAGSATKEGSYVLQVEKGKVHVSSSNYAGVIAGIETVRQLLPAEIESKRTLEGETWAMPAVSITDEPRFGWRGLMLDVSRHFFPKEEVMKLLDVMASYKLNVLHLHLTDAGGWRLRIDKYPRLTSEGAFRTESDWRKWWEGNDRRYLPEGTPGAYGGYYTKEDIRAIVAHASKLHIDILPEVEFPGHSDEVFQAYPELCCAGRSHTSGDFCIGNEKTYTFMRDVLSEVIELFPFEYVHIGGDEAGKSAWKTCPKCQALMREKGMKDVDELQSYIIHRAEEFLNAKGRKLIGWDEILQGGLAPEATVMSWRGEEGGIQASVPSSPTLEPVTSGAPASLTHPAARSRMDTRTMVSIAMLTGIAYIVMLLSKNMPSVYGFLDFDFKDVIICIGGFTFGPFAAAIISILVAFIEMITISTTGPWGFLMNVLATCSFSCTACFRTETSSIK